MELEDKKVQTKVCSHCHQEKPVPKFKIGDTMRTLQEAKDGWTDGIPFVVSIDSEYYNCNSEKIAIKDQDEYEYPPINRRRKPAVIIPKFKVGDEIKTSNEESLTITKIDEKGYWSEDLFICGFDEECKWELVEQKPVDIRFPHYNNIVDKVFGQGNLESWERDEAEALVALAKEELFKDMQKQWKPSDEQMKQLGWIAKQNKDNMIGKDLMSLYQDLKKLREE